MGKQDRLSRHSGIEKSAINRHLFYDGQVMDQYNNDLSEEEDMQDMELEGIYMVI